MTDQPNPPPGNVRRKDPFEVAEARTTLVKKILDGERAVLNARTTKLRAMRLAKEAEDRQAARSQALSEPATPRRRAKPKQRIIS